MTEIEKKLLLKMLHSLAAAIWRLSGYHNGSGAFEHLTDFRKAAEEFEKPEAK